MRFVIGTWKYRVSIVDAPLLNDDGEPCSGQCVWKDRRILISQKVPVLSRFEVLAHELWHAWEHHTGGPGADAESRANTASTFTTMVYREMFVQGGEGALMRLTPEGIVDSQRPIPDHPAANVDCDCPACGTKISSKGIVDGQPTYSAERRTMVIVRTTYCPHCELAFNWHELATRTGGPSGSVDKKPEFLRTDDTREFLKRHGHRFGVLQLTSSCGDA